MEQRPAGLLWVLLAGPGAAREQDDEMIRRAATEKPSTRWAKEGPRGAASRNFVLELLHESWQFGRLVLLRPCVAPGG